ncbi:hypothetical protein AABC73_16165 [Pseudomonas sp. G.S.17]|uniref:hypothetical protein n=1 Tax=Pseudomonas sp. G.S.17 TaxID=3137451 RepID=UPI00311CAD36
MPASAVLPQHVICREMPAVPPSEMALLSTGATLNAAQLALVGYLRVGLNARRSMPIGVIGRSFPAIQC